VRSLLAALLFVAAAGLAIAAPTPAPAPTLNAAEFNKHLKESLEKHVMATPIAPTEALRVVLAVETNKKGQVTRVRSSGTKGSSNDTFNAMCYGNALQAWIRTEDGKAIPGTYKLIYDYSPDTKSVKRTVELVKAGGVDPDAIGAVDDMANAGKRRAEDDQKAWEAAVAKARANAAHASPKPSTSPRP
jgi:hypothetical protein